MTPSHPYDPFSATPPGASMSILPHSPYDQASHRISISILYIDASLAVTALL